MTIEEAIEIVLGPRVWELCEHCDRGYLRGTPARLRANKPGNIVNEDVMCKHCDGSGGQLIQRQREAYALTKTPLPSPWVKESNVDVNGKAHHYVVGPPLPDQAFPQVTSSLTFPVYD